jgi:hypothetical protein
MPCIETELPLSNCSRRENLDSSAASRIWSDCECSFSSASCVLSASFSSLSCGSTTVTTGGGGGCSATGDAVVAASSSAIRASSNSCCCFFLSRETCAATVIVPRVSQGYTETRTGNVIRTPVAFHPRDFSRLLLGGGRPRRAALSRPLLRVATSFESIVLFRVRRVQCRIVDVGRGPLPPASCRRGSIRRSLARCGRSGRRRRRVHLFVCVRYTPSRGAQSARMSVGGQEGEARGTAALLLLSVSP